MSLPTELAEVNGAQDLYDWFGFWPKFHDAEAVSLHLNRGAASVLKVHAWETTDELDSDGFYVLQKHLIVRFLLYRITELSLKDFSIQNVLFGLELTKQDGAFMLTLDSAYGLGGTILAQNVEIELTPGEPEGDEVSGPGMQRGKARPLTPKEKKRLITDPSLRRSRRDQPHSGGTGETNRSMRLKFNSGAIRGIC